MVLGHQAVYIKHKLDTQLSEIGDPADSSPAAMGFLESSPEAHSS